MRYFCEANDVRLASSVTRLSLCLQRWCTLCQCVFIWHSIGVTKLMYLVSHTQFLFQCKHKGDIIKTSHIVGKQDPLSVKWNYFRSCPSLLYGDYTYPDVEQRYQVTGARWKSFIEIALWKIVFSQWYSICLPSVITLHISSKKKKFENYAISLFVLVVLGQNKTVRRN